jgi:hypothetical protein
MKLSIIRTPSAGKLGGLQTVNVWWKPWGIEAGDRGGELLHRSLTNCGDCGTYKKIEHRNRNGKKIVREVGCRRMTK